MFNANTALSIQPGILALSLVSLIVMMGSSMPTPSLPLYASQYPGSNELLVGAVIAGFAIGRLAFDIPAGFLADRFGMSRTMSLGLGIIVGASILAGMAPNYWSLFSARILEGIGSSIYVSAAIAYVILASDSSKRGTTMGTYQSILMLGPIIGPIAGAPVAILFGYNAPYFAFAGMMAIALAVISYLAWKGRFNVKSSIAVAGGFHGPQSPKLSLYINTAGIATFGFAFLRSGVYTTGMPLFAYGSLALSVFDVGIILTVASLANLGASYFSGRLTTRYGMRKPLFGAILFSALLVGLIPMSNSAIQLLVIMTLIGVSSGFFGQSIAWAAEQIETKVKNGRLTAATTAGSIIGVQSHVTRGIGFNRMIGDVGLILGPLFVGYLVSLFSKDPMSWFISFGLTSVILGAVSYFIIGPFGRKSSG